MGSTTEMDVGEICEHFCKDIFARFAIPHRDVQAWRYNVAVKLPTDPKEPIIRFRFMHHRLLLIDCDVDVRAVLQEPEGYVQRLVMELTSRIERACEEQQEHTRIVLRDAGVSVPEPNRTRVAERVH